MTARAALGVVVGKFLPPHRGHSLLVETATRRCDQVLVVVCDRPDDPIPAAVRAGWLAELHPAATVVVTPDDIPEHDPVRRAEEISHAWAERVGGLCLDRWGRRPDLVFSSEEYGPRFARHLGAGEGGAGGTGVGHVEVDRGRLRVPVSGTAVRADPFGQWEFLDPVVRSWYVRRVCVVGAESTGTTTLARALAAHYGCPWVPEYGRAYCAERLAAEAEISWATEDFVQIATRQLAHEDAAARLGSPLLVCDTDALATSIWHERYLRTRSEPVRALAAGRRYALYLLTGDEIPFVQDGTRDGEHVRGWMNGRFREELAARSEPWLEVSGSPELRLATAVAAIDAVCGPAVRRLAADRQAPDQQAPDQQAEHRPGTAVAG